MYISKKSRTFAADYNPPEKSDNLAKAKKVVPLQAKSSRLWGRHRKFEASFKAVIAIIQQWREALEQQAGKVFETPQEDNVS